MESNKKNTLIMMVGLPRSGKSTEARKMGYPIVCPDAIRMALHGTPFFAEAEPMVWAIAKTMVRSLFLAGHKTVILDATNITQARRAEWKSSLWRRDYHVLHTPSLECERRAMASGQDYLLPIIQKMHLQFEPIEPEEICD